jgi:SAM-dependent methyltransferase
MLSGPTDCIDTSADTLWYNGLSSTRASLSVGGRGLSAISGTRSPRRLAHSPSYAERYRSGESRDWIFFDLILDDVRRMGGSPTLLDIGCGGGFDGDVPLQRRLASAAGRYVGVEPDPAIALGGCFTEAHRLRFEDAPIPSGSVDVAFAVMVLEHLVDPASFWDKLYHVLADGGVFWGFTIDARHWFCRASSWAGRLRVKDLYLNLLLGRRGSGRYENYPAFYRANSPEQIRPHVGRFRDAAFLSLAREDQCGPYLPRPLRPIARYLDRRAIRSGRPGTLLAIRLLK